jgi:hypothetical protein
VHLKVVRLIIGVALLTASVASPVSAEDAGGAAVGDDAVVEWNAIMVTTISGQNPFAQARLAAIVQLAVFEAVNAITGDYEPYLAPVSAPAGASAEAAAVAAAHATLSHYIPAAGPTLDAARVTSLAVIPDGAGEDDGIVVGQAAAAALIALRANDGSGPPQFSQPSSADPGVWQTTPTCPAPGGILRHWQDVTPFGVLSTSQFRAAPPPALASPQYARAYAEVLNVGGMNSVNRPSDRADVARFYNSLLAVAAWNGIAQQLAVAETGSLSTNARVFALLNMAISDGLTTVMESKYHYDFWRPETAIRAGATDGNAATVADPDFVPYIAAPCFPGFPSAHASGSYAARSILERAWGSGGHSLALTHPAVPGLTLQYTSLRQVTNDIDDARVFGGIHFRFDQDAGAKLGRQVAQYVYAHSLTPVDR